MGVGGTSSAVSIVVPCCNEEAGLPSLLARLEKMRERGGRDWEVLLVEDGRPDRTFGRVVRAARALPWVTVLRHVINLGLGAALRTGFAHATAPIVCTMDSDCTYAPERLPELVGLVEAGADIATASAWHPGSERAQGGP